MAEEGSRGISQRLGAPDAILEPTVKADLVKYVPPVIASVLLTW